MPGAKPDGQGDQAGEGEQPGSDPGSSKPDNNATPRPDSREGRAINNNGGGGTGGNNPQAGERKDKPEPIPPVNAQAPTNPDPSIAPDVPQSELVTRKIQDLIRDDKFTPDLEKQLGMTRDEAEQFVKKYEKRPIQPPTGPGRDIQAKPGEEKVFDKDRKAPEFNPSAIVSKRNDRSGTTLNTDSVSGLTEGNRSTPPPALRRQWQAYRKNMAGSKSSGATTPPGNNPPSSR